jgi:glycine/D-amino acid oxidase-like deaminating enzyme
MMNRCTGLLKHQCSGPIPKWWIHPASKRKYHHISTRQLGNYLSALITKNCWQASPGKTVDLIRTIGVQNGGEVIEDCRLINIKKEGKTFYALARKNGNEYLLFETDTFINALGEEGDKFAQQLNLYPGLYPVKHQAFITRRLPMMGLMASHCLCLLTARTIKDLLRFTASSCMKQVR